MEVQNRLRVGIDIQQQSSQVYYFDMQEQHVFQNGFLLSEADASQLAAHIGRLVSYVQKQSGLPRPERVCITVSDFSLKILDCIAVAMTQLGYSKNAWNVISHEESYAYYAFSQKKELYVNGVLLLDFEPEGLYTHYMAVMKKNGMEMIPEESHFFGSDDIAAAGQKKKPIAVIEKELTACVAQALKDKIISSVYLTGPGFEGEALPKELTHLICAHRKAFTGQNLFVKGAAYCAMQQPDSAENTSKTDNKRILACRNRVTTGFELNILEHGEEKRFRLIKPGTNWYEAQRSVELILEDMRKIPVLFRPCDGSGDYEEEIDISAIPYRAGKMTRIRFAVQFDSDSHCKITVADLGFGAFVKSSGVVVEKEFTIN